MNGTLPIFSLDVPGQSAPIGSIPGSGEEAFADSLNAALAATAQQDAKAEAQQQSKAPKSDKGDLANDRHDTGASTSGGGVVNEATPSAASSEAGAGAELSVDAAALQAQNATLAAQAARSDEAALTLQKAALGAGIDRQEADAESLLLLNARRTQTAALDAATRQAAAAGVQGLQIVGETAMKPNASSELTPAVGDGRGQPAGAALLAPSDQRALDRAVRDNPFTATPLPSAPLAGTTAADQALQMARSAGSAVNAAAGQNLASASQPTTGGQLDLQQATIEANGEAGAGTARGAISLSAGNPADPASPNQGRSAGIGSNELANRGPASGVFAGDAGTVTDPNRAASASPHQTRADEVVLAAANEKAGTSSAATALAGGVAGSATAQLAAEAGQHQQVDASGFDRVQPVFSADASAQQVERLEPGSGLGSLRAQAHAAYVPAGTQVALQIVRSVPNGVDRFSVHLQPAELGSVDIQLSFESAGRVSALITAERPETLEMLQRDSRLLERSLGDSGLKLSSDGLSFGLKQDQQQQHGQGFQDQAQDRQAALRAGRAYDETSDPAGPVAAGIVHASGLRLLDIET